MAFTNNSDFSAVLVKSGAVEPFKPSEIYVSNEGLRITEIVVDLCLSFIIANVGIVSNIIVIIVFAKQGFNESMNISMTAISIWDLLKCISGSVQRMAGPISLVSGADAESWENIMTVGMNYFICFATYVSSALAAYVALERCLCVTLPFTVKTLLTPKVTFIAMVTISIVVFGSFTVIFGIYDIVWVYSPKWNTTVAVYKYNDFFKANQGPLMQYYNLSGVIWPSISFVVIIVCTVIIFYQLQKASKFRNSNAPAASSDTTLSNRDRQVIKMLLVIIVIYVTNLFPRIALYVSKFLIYDFYFLRKFHNLFLVIACWLFVFDLTNASVNLFVFLTMSTNFRATAKEMFGVGKKDSKEMSGKSKS